MRKEMGLLLIFAGLSLLMISAAFNGGDADFGGVILIGPIPIVIGIWS